MSNNLANLMVGFGLDLSALQKDAPEAYRILNQQTLGMTAEMKRASREGAESFRLIDEALGIHVSRPLTRILTQEFPALAQGLQAVLGGAVFGAVATIGIEAFDKVARKIEEAEKAQEKFAESSRHGAETVTTVLGGLQNKLAELSGDHRLKFSIQGAAEAKHAIEEIGKAFDETEKDSEKASSGWNKFLVGIGSIGGDIARGAARLGDMFGGDAIAEATGGKNLHDRFFDPQQIANMKDALKDMRVDLEIALNTDAAKGTHQALALIQTDIKAATEYLRDMEKAGDASGAALARSSLEFFKNSETAATLSQQIAGVEQKKAAEEEAKKEIHETQEEMKGWNEENNKAFLAWLKLNEEISKAYDKLSAQALPDSAGRFKEFQKVNGPIGTVTPPPGAPELADQAELQKVTDDQNESWKKAGEVLASIESPQQKYAAQLAILNTLEQQGRINSAEHALAVQSLGEQLTKAELHMQEMGKELEKLLSHSTSATDGVRAFFLELQIDAGQNGKAAFDLLNQGLKGFEDELTKTVFTGKAKWEDMFRSMGESAFKFMLQKDVAGFFQLIGGTGIGKAIGLPGILNPGQPATGAGQQPQTAASVVLPSLTKSTAAALPDLGGGGGGPALAAAATTLQSGSTLLMTAATTLQAAAASLNASGLGNAAGAGGSGGAPDILGLIPGFASGTDDAPGGLAWVGERGPELLNLPGGSSVIPAASLRGGGSTHNWNIDARGNEDVGARIVRAITLATPMIEARAMTAVQELARRTPRSR